MTSTTPNPAAAPAALPAYLPPQKVTQARVLRSEWTKLRTQPSALWALLSAVIVVIGFGLLFAVQIAAGLLPGSWSQDVGKYLPAPAGLAVTSVRPDPSSLAPWVGFGVFCLYAAVLLSLAALRIRRGDA
jgi:predicted anti-sigma-YlaC factor YlaD